MCCIGPRTLKELEMSYTERIIPQQAVIGLSKGLVGGLNKGGEAIKDIAVKYQIETRSAVKAGIILVLALVWRDILQKGAQWVQDHI